MRKPLWSTTIRAKLDRQRQKAAFQVIFAYSEVTGTLDVYVQGDKKVRHDLEEIFCRLILQENLPEPGPRKPYNLVPLRSREFDFPTNPEDNIIATRVKVLRLSVASPGSGRMTFEGDERRRRGNVYDLMEDFLNHERLTSAVVYVTQVVLEVTVRTEEGERQCDLELLIPIAATSGMNRTICSLRSTCRGGASRLRQTVIEFWTRADSEDGAFRGDEARALGRFEALVAAGILKRAGALIDVECDACGDAHIESVVWVTAPAGKPARAYINCPVAGRVRVEAERLEIWNIDLDALAKSTGNALGIGESPRALIDDRLWLLGTARADDQSRDVFLVRGATWLTDGSQLSTNVRLAIALRPIILFPHHLPDDPAWRPARTSGRTPASRSPRSTGRSRTFAALSRRG